MSTSTRRLTAVVATGAMAVAALALAAVPSQAAKSTAGGGGTKTVSTTTAQGVVIQLKSAGSFMVIENDTYGFNNNAALTYFTTNVTGPVRSCSGSKTACADTNAPLTAPAQPPASDSRRYDAGVANMCVFASGGVLTGLDAYTAGVTIKGQNGTGNFTYTWTYKVDPASTDPVAPLTAWDLVQDDSGQTAHIVVNGWFAAESSMISSSFPSPGKLSFSMDATRVANLQVTVNGTTFGPSGTTADGIAISETQYPAWSPVTGLDFPFLQADQYSSNGTTTQLKYGPSALALLLADSSTSNDSVTALTYGELSAMGFDLLPGDYTFTFTGAIKDVATSTYGSFTVTRVLKVVTSGCGTA